MQISKRDRSSQSYFRDDIRILDDLPRPSHGDHSFVGEENPGDLGVFHAGQDMKILPVGTVPDLCRAG